MNAETKVGPIVQADGTPAIIRADRTGAVVTTNGHGFYTEAVLRGTVFSGSITGQVTTVGTAATYTGLCLSNPVGSGRYLVINKVGYSFIVAFPAGSHIGLMTGYNGTTDVTHTSAVTVRSQLFAGQSSGVGKLDSSATMPTAPTVNMIIGAGITGAITTAPQGMGGVVDVDGSIVLQPGAYCAIYTSTISGAAGGAFSFSWEEITA